MPQKEISDYYYGFETLEFFYNDVREIEQKDGTFSLEIKDCGFACILNSEQYTFECTCSVILDKNLKIDKLTIKVVKIISQSNSQLVFEDFGIIFRNYLLICNVEEMDKEMESFVSSWN